ncbi:hypothetical protein ACFW1P_12885 [Paenibacillus sp. NPDC058910]|uniref:hypothetical protein n=1 Tax=Paenibacillus sp. NPDC058910 TaxID=3346670 RepID=UPI0036850C64
MILVDLAEYNLVLGDGRDYREYEGDTRYVAETIMAADALMIERLVEDTVMHLNVVSAIQETKDAAYDF